MKKIRQPQPSERWRLLAGAERHPLREMHTEGVSNLQAGLKSSRPKDTEEHLQAATAAASDALPPILDRSLKGIQRW